MFGPDPTRRGACRIWRLTANRQDRDTAFHQNRSCGILGPWCDDMTEPMAPPSHSAGTPDVAPDVESSTDRYALRFAGTVGKWFLDVQRGFVAQVDDDVRLGADLGQVMGESLDEIGELLPAVVE